MENKKVLVLLSGGLDSTTALAIMQDQGYKCFCIAFDYGQRNKEELEIARLFAISRNSSFQTIKFTLPFLENSDSVLVNLDAKMPAKELMVKRTMEVGVYYVPGRNTLFLSWAVHYALQFGIGSIVIGIAKGDAHPDRRPEYINAYQDLLNIAKYPIEILTPLAEMSKVEIVQRGLELGIDYSKTLSCYNPTAMKSCGACRPCYKRKVTFEELGLPDPTIYI